jgi:hypothetical protein
VHPIAIEGEYLFVLQDVALAAPTRPKLASYWALGSTNFVAGHLDDAAILLSKARAANPRLFFIHFWLAASLALKGNLDEQGRRWRTRLR